MQHLVFLLHNLGEDRSHQLLAAEKLLDLFKDSSNSQDLKEKGVTFLEEAKMVSTYIDFMGIIDTFLHYNIYTQTQAVDAILAYSGEFSSLDEHAEMLAYLFKNVKLANLPEKEDLLGLIFQEAQNLYDYEFERLKEVNLELDGGGRALSIAREILESR